MAGEQPPLLLIQFAREPVAGRVKTRMQPLLTAEEACELHRELVLWTCRRLVEARLGPVRLAVAGDPGHALFRQCAALGAAEIVSQRGGDLGQRMRDAIEEGLRHHAAVVLVGSDCPGIDAAYLRAARTALRHSRIVLGPAQDGGYVLLAMRCPLPNLFEQIPWGTGRVLSVTRQRLRQAGMEWVELAPLADIDRPADLAHWKCSQRATGAWHSR
jgi:rSAM/selenodomain-associated transferase 1